ncbi:MAG: TraR/DksA C4-type zinc finger protein [Bryobacteraceae bacterium]
MRRSAVIENSSAAYREMLLEKREEVLSGLGIKFDMLARMGRLAEDDQAQISNEETVSLHLNSLDYVQLRLIEEALDRLNSGDYGICLSCEEPIPPKRLRALSWARYCVRCQEALSGEAQQEGNDGRFRLPIVIRQ